MSKKKKKPETKKKDEEEGDDDGVPKEEKKKENFPESKMDFDAFKKEFFNSSDRKAVLDKLFATDYDRNAFSIYYIRYQKLESEGKELWLTENSRDSFIQRVEQGRKHAFGSLGIYGVAGDYEIKGVWMWRGLEVPAFMDENPQFEFYDKRPLNPDSEADKKLYIAIG